MRANRIFVVLIIVAILFAAMVGFGALKDEDPASKAREKRWEDVLTTFIREPEIAAGDLVDARPAGGCTRQGQLVIVPAGGTCALRIVASDAQAPRKLMMTSLRGTKVTALFNPVPMEDMPQTSRKFELGQSENAKSFSVFASGGTLVLVCESFPGVSACTVRIGS